MRVEELLDGNRDFVFLLFIGVGEFDVSPEVSLRFVVSNVILNLVELFLSLLQDFFDFLGLFFDLFLGDSVLVETVDVEFVDLGLVAIVELLDIERVVSVSDIDLSKLVMFFQDLIVGFLGFELDVTVT